jgi:hypothetical protein
MPARKFGPDKLRHCDDGAQPDKMQEAYYSGKIGGGGLADHLRGSNKTPQRSGFRRLSSFLFSILVFCRRKASSAAYKRGAEVQDEAILTASGAMPRVESTLFVFHFILVGQRSSISSISLSAQRTASLITETVAGTRLEGSKGRELACA